MKKYVMAALLLAGACAGGLAQTKSEFGQFVRTKDSLMHIAFYDRNISVYKKQYDEFMAGYGKLPAQDKEKYKGEVLSQHYNLACIYSITGDKKNALDYLERSKNYDYDHLLNDHDLDNIRQEPRFAKFLNIAKHQKTKYELVLQKEAKYNNAEKSNLPAFTYQSPDDPGLAKLRKMYNLDSIAGEGSDVSRIINLMEWVHYLIPHDGSKGNPETKNALSLIKECRRDGKSLNCRGLAIILNEVYLAEGFKSRFVTCLPKDINDQDCHVITMVWSASLNKWLWMDPTFMAYVMDENGVPQSIEEVRYRLINDKPLILNPDANRNHATTQVKSNYLNNYMAKNLYKLECAVSSESNYETWQDNKTWSYITLVPGNNAHAPEVQKDKHGVAVRTIYYTNNAAAFWAAPPALKAVASGSKGHYSHTQSEYEEVMDQFKDCYNSGRASCVSNMFPGDDKFWTDSRQKDVLARYGKLISYSFMGMEMDNEYQDVALFKMVFEKSVHCMGIALDKNEKFESFRLKTTSSYIDWLLAKAIDKDNAKGKGSAY